MRKLIIVLFCLFTLSAIGQINCVTYQLDYDQNESKYTVSLVILNGNATTILERAQYNSQVTIVVPTDTKLEITDSHNPIENHQFFTSDEPTDWLLYSAIAEPEASPENDFYAVVPTLSPVSFYEELTTEEIVPLFSFATVDTVAFLAGIRLFDNENDPGSLDPGMGGGNFSNVFRIGGSDDIYISDISESCITNTEDVFKESIKISPNPFESQLSLEHDSEIATIEILDNQGRQQYISKNINRKSFIINTASFLTGIYIIRIQFANGSEISQKVVKI